MTFVAANPVAGGVCPVGAVLPGDNINISVQLPRVPRVLWETDTNRPATCSIETRNGPLKQGV